MPNKTIYVAEADLPLLEQAQDLAGGSLSAAITQALRQYVETAAAQQRGFGKVTLPIGQAGAQHRKRFLGFRLARWRGRTADGKQMEEMSVYRTAKGKLVLHVRRSPNWWFWSDPDSWRDWMDPEWHRGKGDWDWAQPAEFELEVFEQLEALRGRVPPELFELVASSIDTEPIEVLDI